MVDAEVTVGADVENVFVGGLVGDDDVEVRMEEGAGVAASGKVALVGEEDGCARPLPESEALGPDLGLFDSEDRAFLFLAITPDPTPHTTPTKSRSNSKFRPRRRDNDRRGACIKASFTSSPGITVTNSGTSALGGSCL